MTSIEELIEANDRNFKSWNENRGSKLETMVDYPRYLVSIDYMKIKEKTEPAWYFVVEAVIPLSCVIAFLVCMLVQ